MHQEDDNYDEDHDYDNSKEKYKHYFKFDPEAWDSWGKMLYDALSDVTNNFSHTWYVYGFPVNSFPPKSGVDKKSLQNLGVNYYKEKILKHKYSINKSIDMEHRKHLEQNAVHFLQQPSYYKGMFDILN